MRLPDGEYWKLGSKFLSRPMSRRLMMRSGLVAGAGLAGAALLGCGDDDDGGEAPPAATGTGATATGATATVAPAAKRKPIMNISRGTDPSSVDPHKSSGAPEAGYARLVYGNGIVRWNFDLDIRGDLAEAWDVSPDGTVYTFHLRPGLKFSNGKPLDASVVVENIEAILDPDYGSFLRSDWSIVQKAEAVDATTVQFTLGEPSAVFLATASHRTMIADMSSFKPDEPVGHGPWIMEDWARGSHFTYVKNPDYYAADHVLAEGINMVFLSDPNAIYNALRTGELDIASIATTFVPEQQQKSELQLYNSPGSAHRIIPLIREGSPFQDIRVRQAIDLGIDRDDYVIGVTDGLGQKTVGAFYPGHPYYVDTPIPERDVERAKALLNEAGVEDLTVDMPSYNTADSLTWAELFQAHMKDIGITINIVPMESATLFTNHLFCTEPQDDLLLMCDANLLNTGWTRRIDPDQEFYPKFHTGGPHNRGGYSNPAVDEALEQARVVTDQDERYKLYAAAQQHIRDDLAWIFTYYSNVFHASTQMVKGYQIHQGDYFLQWYEDIYVEA